MSTRRRPRGGGLTGVGTIAGRDDYDDRTAMISEARVWLEALLRFASHHLVFGEPFTDAEVVEHVVALGLRVDRMLEVAEASR